jgi:uncharacterized protein with PhoU and TrkA domain
VAGIVSFFVVIMLSIIIVRIATALLSLSGLSEDSAKFQARSAFTGTGFTTRETENVVNHPFRRRVIMVLMLVRNFGFVSVISTVILSFVGTSSNIQVLIRVGILLAGLLVLYLISRSRLLDRGLRRIVERALRNSKLVRVADYENLLNFAGEYEVIESQVHADSWLADRTLQELELGEEGILMLGIRRTDGYFVGTPNGSSLVSPGDRVIMYGRDEALREISERKVGPDGEEQHALSVRRQRERRSNRAVDATQSAKREGQVKSAVKRLFGRSK